MQRDDPPGDGPPRPSVSQMKGRIQCKDKKKIKKKIKKIG